jgi:Zn-dependent protease with chaperone function
MINEQFDDLFSELEDQVRRNPSAYGLKVHLLALLGNVYVSFILLILFALMATLSALYVRLESGSLLLYAMGIIGGLFFPVLMCLRVRIEPPTGIEIRAGHAPDLFATINDLSSKLGAPRFDHVLITDELNAGIQQLPRLGIFGWPRNYLLIGLPLMKSLTRQQFKAVLAHEFGHLAKGDGVVSHSIYRQRRRWIRLMAVLEVTESKGRFLFMPFLNWFVPHFGALSFPLARANEYEADAISVRLTSSRVTAEALTGMEVVGGYLSDLYWPRIDAEFGEHSQPDREPYSEMSDAFATCLGKESCHIWLDPAMARKTTYEDTHPALSNRLAAIGEQPSFEPPEPGQAADGLLGPSLDATTRALDASWKDKILSTWELRHQEIQEGRRRLKDLNEMHANGVDLTLRERRERAELTEAIGKNATAALDQLRALHESFPDDANICLALGSRLMMRNDNSGCALVERAIRSDDNAILQGCELLRDYHWRNGSEEEYQAWNALLMEETQFQRNSLTERNRVLPTDKFEPHGLPGDTLAALVTQLRAIPGLSTVYFMKKRVLFPQRPLYVLGYRVTASFRLRGSQTEVFEGIQNAVQLPGDTFIVNVDGENYRLRRRFRRMRWPKIQDPAPSFLHTIVTATKKILGVLAVLGGIGILCLVVAIVIFNLGIETGLPRIGWCAAFIVICSIMISVGIRWLIDPID